FLSDPAVARRLDKDSDIPKSSGDRVALAGGAPGRLLAGSAWTQAMDTARRMLDAVSKRGGRYEAAWSQAVSRARGDVADTRGSIRMSMAALEAIRLHSIGKGDVLSIARIAGIMAAKRTPDLIPLCHPLMLDDVDVVLRLDPELPGVRAESRVASVGRTGVE